MINYEARMIIEVVEDILIDELLYFKSFPLFVIFGDVLKLNEVLTKNHNKIIKHHLEIFNQNKLMEYFDITETKARIEYGSIIRSNVTISDTAIILMGAVINTNVSIGDKTMIDMNAVIGSGAIIKNNCHIGAGAVIAGVMEPISKSGVIIEDNVLIGANATILSGVTVGKGAIVGAGSVVTKDVDEHTTVAGVPARVINEKQEWMINNCLR